LRVAHPSYGKAASAGETARAAIWHLLCILALMWPAIVNRQPLFFPDTTSYVRAADSAVYLTTGIATAWSDRIKAAKGPKADRPTAKRAKAPPAAGPAPAQSFGNDLANGQIMAGRSPYFGSLLYAAYVSSDFWLFVLGQAAIAYWLLILILRRFDRDDPRIVRLAAFAMAALTTLPFCNSLLLADVLGGFGCIALMLIATDTGGLRRWERIGLLALLAVSAVSHPTHVYIFVVMAIVLFGGRRLLRASLPPGGRWRWLALPVILLGFVSAAVTDLAVTKVFGRAPQLVPLMTARFIEDGPGADYLRTHCDRPTFAVCAVRDRLPLSSQEFLWSRDPARGVFLTSDAPTRRALSAEDRPFAIAVLKAYPLRQTGWMLRNTIEQALRFDVSFVNVTCTNPTRCWGSLPTRVGSVTLTTPSGRHLWPTRLLKVIHYLVAFVGLVAILSWLVALIRRRLRSGAPISADEATLCLWIAAGFAALAINAALGGAISEPQGRYQARLIWIVPLIAGVLGLARTRYGSLGGKRMPVASAL